MPAEEDEVEAKEKPEENPEEKPVEKPVQEKSVEKPAQEVALEREATSWHWFEEKVHHHGGEIIDEKHRKPIMHPFEHRGKKQESDEAGNQAIPGSFYFDAAQVKEHRPIIPTYVGFSYQVSSLFLIDEVTETFHIVLDLNIWFKVHDDDKDLYEEWRRDGTVDLQKINDDHRIKVKPPILEIRNAVSPPDYNSCRVTQLSRGWDHTADPPRWAWYVTLYLQVRLQCYEEFEMQNFPFTRNSLQVQVQLKQNTKQYLLVPYNCRDAMPHYQWKASDPDPSKHGIEPVQIRGNSYKTQRSPGNWAVENHHVAFVPSQYLQVMPTGNKFSTAVVTVLLKQSPNFYLLNTTIVLFFLPVLSALSIFVEVDSVADRMSIVLTLLLTMSAYKVSISEWVPQKDYLTYIDWYVLIGFGVILIQGGIVMASQVLLDRLIVTEANLVNLEIGVTTFLTILWAVPHFGLLCRGGRESFYPQWRSSMRGEKESLEVIAKDTVDHNELIKATKFKSGMQPMRGPDKATAKNKMTRPRIPDFDPQSFMPKPGDVDAVKNEGQNIQMYKTSLRVKDPYRSLEFYRWNLFFHLLYHEDKLNVDRPHSRYVLNQLCQIPAEQFDQLKTLSLQYNASGLDSEREQLNQERKVIADSLTGNLELLWFHGTEKDKDEFVYNSGNSDATGTASGRPVRGGFRAITVGLPDVYEATNILKESYFEICKSPNDDNNLGDAGLGWAEIKDPDGYIIVVVPSSGVLITKEIDCNGIKLGQKARDSRLMKRHGSDSDRSE